MNQVIHYAAKEKPMPDKYRRNTSYLHGFERTLYEEGIKAAWTIWDCIPRIGRLQDGYWACMGDFWHYVLTIPEEIDLAA